MKLKEEMEKVATKKFAYKTEYVKLEDAIEIAEKYAELKCRQQANIIYEKITNQLSVDDNLKINWANIPLATVKK